MSCRRDFRARQCQPDVFFRMEFTKNEIYTGEQVLANFMLYSKEDIPGCRSRQVSRVPRLLERKPVAPTRPIPLSLGFGNGEYKKALVGSYILTSMIGKEDPSIVPMKIVVRLRTLHARRVSRRGRSIARRFLW